MYAQHFGFREEPFSLNPDPRFLYLSETHREALAHLVYGVETGKGFIVITGDVGTGKTTLVRKFLDYLSNNAKAVLITNPGLSRDDFFLIIAQSIGLGEDIQGSKARFLSALERHLQESRVKGERVVLVVDEAQNLPLELLEEIRLLSNVETAAEKLLQVVLVGQQELNDKLMSYELRQLRQRISLKFHVSPLSAVETGEYLKHRLSVAGYVGPELFTSRAVKEIFSYSRGYPRVINVLSDMALLTAYSKNAARVSQAMVRESTNDIAASYPLSRYSPNRAWQLSFRRKSVFLIIALSLIFLFLFGSTALWYLFS